MPEEQATEQTIGKVLRITEYAYKCLRDVAIHHYHYLTLKCGTLVAWPKPEVWALRDRCQKEQERAASAQDIWWRGEDGPELVAGQAYAHRVNLPSNPDCYQVGEPKARYKIEETFEGYED